MPQTPDTTIKKFANATPRPWALGDRLLHQGVMSRNLFNERQGLYSGGFVAIMAEADAELTHAAVNSYDALREAATEAMKVLKLEFPGSIKRKAAIAKLESALSLVDHPEEAIMKCQRCNTRDAIKNETFCLPCRQELDQQRRDQRRSANEAQS